MSEIEFLPAMHNGRIIDFLDSQQDSFFKFLFGIYANVVVRLRRMNPLVVVHLSPESSLR